MIWIKLIILLTGIPAIYLVYHRYMIFKPEFRKHLEAFAFGVFVALLLLLLAPFINSIIPLKNHIASAFFKAAFIEKGLALIALLIVFKHYINFSAAEAMLSAMIFGLAFAFTENIHFAATFGDTALIPRTIFSLPFHITSCGILGFYLGRAKMSRTGSYNTEYIIKGFIISAAVHGTFDFLLLKGAPFSYGAAPLLIAAVAFMEINLARAFIIPPRDILKNMNIAYEEWRIIYRQTRYERWILQSMGRQVQSSQKLFVWEPGIVKLCAVILLIAAGTAGVTFRNDLSVFLSARLSDSDEIMLYGLFPLSASVLLIIIGAVNADFFRTNELKIPVISEAHLVFDKKDETFVCYSLSRASCFVKTYESLGLDKRVTMLLSYGNRIPVLIKGHIIWENHDSRQYPQGSIIQIDRTDGTLARYLFAYSVFKLFKGLSFNLKLPGFELTKQLFVHPVSAMQEDVFYPEGSVIFNEGDEARHFYLLKKGSVSFIKRKPSGEEIWIGGIEQGEIFGEMAVIPGRKRVSRAVCETDSIIALSDRDKLQDLIRYNSDFALSLIQMLAERAQNSEKILLEYIALIELQQARNQK
jgi:protease PrsW